VHQNVDGRDKPGHDGVDGLMCIACELGLMLAMDDLPDGPPPGFPRPPPDEAARFACDAPLADEAPPRPAKDEPAP
jgi:hypothetical protein